MLEELLPVRRRVQGADAGATLSTMNNPAVAYQGEGRHGDARRLYEEILRLRPGDDPTDTLMIRVMSNFLGIHNSNGEKPRRELITRYKKMTDAAETLLGFAHPNTNALRNMYFWSLLTANDRGQRIEAAHDLVDRAIERAERELGFRHDVTLWW